MKGWFLYLWGLIVVFFVFRGGIWWFLIFCSRGCVMWLVRVLNQWIEIKIYLIFNREIGYDILIDGYYWGGFDFIRLVLFIGDLIYIIFMSYIHIYLFSIIIYL
jgi:hypothetical protein